MIWFVSRHSGALVWARVWARSQGLHFDVAVSHLAPSQVADGDDVYGLLPPHIAARLCQRGVRYWHLAIDLPEALRGAELSAATLAAHGARFVRLHIEELMT